MEFISPSSCENEFSEFVTGSFLYDPISVSYKGQTFIILFNGLFFVIGQSSNKATTSYQPFHLWAVIK